MVRETHKEIRLSPRLFLGLIPGIRSRSLAVPVPLKLNPLPLNLVFKDLRDPNRFLDSKMCRIRDLRPVRFPDSLHGRGKVRGYVSIHPVVILDDSTGVQSPGFKFHF